MEKLKVLLFVCVFLTTAQLLAAETYMSADQAKIKFGSRIFDAQKFKLADKKTRGQMAADLVQKKFFVGKPLQMVRDLLGQPDGYFENKGIPAYLISEQTSGDVWQLIFLPDKDWKKVDEVKINKNCCY